MQPKESLTDLIACHSPGDNYRGQVVDMAPRVPDDDTTGKYVSYYDSKRQKRFKTRLGRFLSKLTPQLYTAEKEQWVIDIQVAMKQDTLITLVTGQTIPDTYVRLQNYGVDSCMSTRPQYLTMYAENPEIVSLAYIIDGTQAARCLVWTIKERQYYDVIYCSARRVKVMIEDRLQAKGIAKIRNSDTLSVEVANKANVWPFMDSFIHGHKIEGDTYRLSMRDDDKEFICDCQNGSHSSSCPECINCGGEANPDYSYTHEEEIWCENCFHDTFTACGCCEDTTPLEDTYHIESECIDVCQSCLDYYFTLCKDCDDSFRGEGSEEDGICGKCIDDYYVCNQCGELTHSDDITHTPDDEAYCNDCFADLYVVCSGCDTYIPIDDDIDGMCADCAVDKRVN